MEKISNCCWEKNRMMGPDGPDFQDVSICPHCKEHCEFVEDDKDTLWLEHVKKKTQILDIITTQYGEQLILGNPYLLYYYGEIDGVKRPARVGCHLGDELVTTSRIEKTDGFVRWLTVEDREYLNSIIKDEIYHRIMHGNNCWVTRIKEE